MLGQGDDLYSGTRHFHGPLASDIRVFCLPAMKTSYPPLQLFECFYVWKYLINKWGGLCASDGKVLVSCIFKRKLLSVPRGTLVILVQEAKFHRELVKIGRSWVV